MLTSTPLIAALVLGCGLLAACSAFYNDDAEVVAEAQAGNFYALETESLAGEAVGLDQYQGKVALVVNVASQCGYTKQYAGLQELHETYADRGLVVMGFPSGDFGGQEFDSAQEIREFCDSRFGVTFPMFAKGGVKEGESQSDIYAFLGGATGQLPGWNFGKYLVDKDGKVLQFFETRTAPNDPELIAAIEAALDA
jgi:glutathione peroxidase